MKKPQLKVFLFTVLTLASILSYVYLQSQKVPTLTEVPLIEQEVEESQNTSLPDAAILNTIVKKTKKYILLDL